MAELTIALSDEVAARLRSFAAQLGETPEEVAKSFIEASLPPPSLQLAPDDPDGTKMALSLIGALSGLGIQPFNTNEEIDRVLAEEAANPHEDE